MTYVDGFVAAVPNANREKFIEHAKISAEVVKECGRLPSWSAGVMTFPMEK